MPQILSLILMILLSLGAIASEQSKEMQQGNPVKAAKRAKKVGICSTCGKPETKCECEDEKDADKKGDTHERGEAK